MVRRLRSILVALGRPRIRAWTSCRNRLPDARARVHRNQSLCHHQSYGRSRSLEEKSSCLERISFDDPLTVLMRFTCDASDLVNNAIHQLFADRVVSTSI